MTLDTINQKYADIEAQNSVLRNRINALEVEKKLAEDERKTAEAINKSQQIEIDYLKQCVKMMKQAIFGQKSEKVIHTAAQLCFVFNEAEMTIGGSQEEALDTNEDAEQASEQKKKKGGRKSLPKSIPREQVLHQLSGEDLLCKCGSELTKIGEEQSEEIHVIPAKVIVREHIRCKYACKCCGETVKRADAPFRPLNKCIASAGLLADMLVKKYSDHLPLYRQSEIWKRYGIELSRSTLSNWVIGCAEKLEPIVQLLKEEMLASDYICSDETTVNVLDEPKNTNYMWMHQSGIREKRCVIYEYNKSRSQEVAEKFLSTFKGYHQSDGYVGYDNLHKKEGVIGVGCMAHARRKFVSIIKISTKGGIADEIVAKMDYLYKIEKKIAYLNDLERKEIRNKEALPKLKELHETLKYYADTAPPESYLGKAIQYALNQWTKLNAYLLDGRLRIDNNDSERAIKPFVIGRKNWIFCKSEGGAAASSIIYSIIETCKANNVNAYNYLKYILENIHKAKNDDELRGMLPFNLDAAMLKENRRA